MKFIFRKFLLLTCILLNYAHTAGKSTEISNGILCGISTLTLTENLRVAVLNADSLIASANSDKQRIAALMTKAKAYFKQGNYPLSVKIAMHADSIASYTSNFRCQATISGFIAKSFRALGLKNISSRYLDRAQKANDMIKDSEIKNFNSVDILHERAYHFLDEKKYAEANELAITAAKQIPQNAQDIKKLKIVEATNDQIMGISELRSGKLKAADSLLNSSLQKLTNIESSLKPRVYIALGEVALKESNYKTAHQFLAMVDQYLKAENDEDLEKISYDSWSEYYKDTGNMENALYYRNKSADLLNAKIDQANILSDSLLQETTSREELYRFLYILSLSGIILFLVFAAYFLLVWKRKIWIHPEATDPSNDIPTHLFLDATELSIPDKMESEKDNSKLNQIKISKYTETNLFRKLEKLEEEKFYLEKNVKLDQIASKMGTNSKYVSYIILKYRQMDFYEFIQKKRIEHFINLIKVSPELLDFKLAILAQKCGFSSLSKFSTSFKNITGMPPSTYINLIKKELNT